MESVLKDSNEIMMTTSRQKSPNKFLNDKDPLNINTSKKYKSKSYEQMVIEAILNLKDRSGSTLQGIKKYISSVFLIPAEHGSRYVSKSLKKGIETGVVIKADKKLRYKLSAETIKKIKENIKDTKSKKSGKKTEKNKENIAPKVEKKSTKTKIKKSKQDKEIKSSKELKIKSKNEKEVNSKSNKKNKLAIKDPEDIVIEPKKKKTNENNNEIEIKNKNKIEVKSKVKPKLPQTNKSITIAAGNKLKKQARKSLIKLNMRKLKNQKIELQKEKE